MSDSRLSVGRYGPYNQSYLKKAEELFTNNIRHNNVETTVDSLSNLLNDFKRLFEQTQKPENGLFDTILEIETKNSSRIEQIYAQKQLLIARSAYFENAFKLTESTDDFSFITDEETGLETIRFIDDFSPAFDIHLLREVVEYMYWGFWEARNLERTKHIFILGSQFDLKDLRNVSGEELSNNLSFQNAAEFLIISHRYEAKILKKKCLSFIIDNRKQIDKKYLEDVLLKEEGGKQLIGEIYEEDVYSKRNF